jgi:hypothetical protein
LSSEVQGVVSEHSFLNRQARIAMDDGRSNARKFAYARQLFAYKRRTKAPLRVSRAPACGSRYMAWTGHVASRRMDEHPGTVSPVYFAICTFLLDWR